MISKKTPAGQKEKSINTIIKEMVQRELTLSELEQVAGGADRESAPEYREYSVPTRLLIQMNRQVFCCADSAGRNSPVYAELFVFFSFRSFMKEPDYSIIN